MAQGSATGSNLPASSEERLVPGRRRRWWSTALAVAAFVACGWVLVGRLSPRDPVGLTLLEENVGRIDALAGQVAAGELGLLLPTIQSLVQQLPSDTSAYFVLEDPGELRRLRAELKRWNLQDPKRFTLLHDPQLRIMISWARDQYVALRDKAEHCVLLHPQLIARQGRQFDLPSRLAGAVPEARVERSALFLEAGDLLAGRKWVLVGSSVVRQAHLDGIHDSAVLRRRLESLLGKPVIFAPRYGLVSAEQGDLHHLDLIATVLQDDSVLLADLDWGARLAEEMSSEGVALPGPIDARDAPVQSVPLSASRDMVDAVRRALEGAGIRVRRIPLYLVPRRGCAVTYNNVLQEETRGGPVVYLPQYGAGPLDREAAAVYESLGYQVRPVDVRQVFQYQGAVHCLFNVISRRRLHNGGG